MSVELDSISSNGRGSESDASMNSQGQETLNQLTPETAGPPLQSTAQHQPTACQVDIMMEFDDTDADEGEYFIESPYGQVKVTIQGDSRKAAIVTYHNLGLNHDTNFCSFLGDQAMSALVTHFCWYHVDAPGQERNAAGLPDDFVYPTMTQLAEQIEYIADHFQLSHFIGLGVGSGANILARYATINPDRVQGLILLNLSPSSMPWTSLSRIVGKIVCWQLKGRSDGLTHLATNHLLRQIFGPLDSNDIDGDLVEVCKEYLDSQNPHNLALLLDSYYRRSCITADFCQDVHCKCLFVVSSNFDNKEQVVKLCSMLDSQKATLLEVANTSGLLLHDQPAKIATALTLFVQGLGLAPSLSSKSAPRLASGATAAEGESFALTGHTAKLHPREH